ncbi:MAG: hypothetical protein K9N51_08610 [Candidatus Pacebacteria bacterium]|nr:hypothetical protein [Candidatus Paceibacterota bacterium]
MNQEEQKRFIAEKLNEGLSLGQVQKCLSEEHGINITYLDLRLIASELEVDWQKLEEAKPSSKKAEDTLVQPEPEEAPPPSGTQVTISKVARPDAAMSGSVQFASGAKAEWFVDHMGRLGLAPETGSSKPTEQDIKEFQEELQRQLKH